MAVSQILFIIIVHLHQLFSQETTDIFYNLTDMTIRNTKIGNLMSSKTKSQTDIMFEKAILMDPTQLFDLKKNGDLYSKVDIDRDDVCVKLSCCKDKICTVTIKAHLFVKQTPTSFNIIIKIIDENDNKPQFPNFNNVMSIPESADLHSIFKLPIAVDKDSTEYGIDSYRLLDPSNTFENIMQHNEPYLKVLKSLDREKLDHYSMQLLVFDKSRPPQTSAVNMNVKVTDVNDNAPYFVEKTVGGNFRVLNASEIYKIDFTENHSGNDNVYNFHAKDDDEGDNARITYSISPTLSQPPNIVQQKFSLESPHKTATIQLRQGLDYEVEIERVIHLVIVATDNGKPAKSASISLTISLLDINDNLPVITESEPKNISENDSENKVLKIFTITDKDEVSNNKIQCVLHDRMSSQFELVRYDWNLYGLRNKVAFDYEVRKMELVQIKCIDKAEPELTQTSDFYVNIIDRNDNVPQWNENSYHVKIYENDKPDMTIKTVTASDADSSEFGKFYYNISEAINENKLHFVRINSATGDIQMTKSVDHEEFPQLHYFITVTDNADNNPDFMSKVVQHSNTTKLIIEIMDVNDNIPRYKGKTNHFQVSEDAMVKTKIGRLHFHDNDDSPNNIFKISLLDSEDKLRGVNYWFEITDNDTIMVKNKLDREEINNFSVIVQVIDQGFPPQTGSEKILIEILDYNDNYPVLKNPQNDTFISGGGIQQSSQYQTKLIQIEAKDDDCGHNGSLTYRITQSNLSNSQYISINEETGDIRTNWRDFQVIEVGVYSIWVSISDKGIPPLSIHVIFHINVTSISSNQLTEAYMSNIVILILIIVCSLALIVSLIAAIFWVRFRVSNDSPITCPEEIFEREHLNKEVNSHQYSLMNLDKTFRQNSYDNNRLNSYETYQGFHHDSYIQSHNHTNYSHNTIHDVMDKSRITPCEDCLTVYGTVPPQFNRFDTSISRLRHPIIPDLNTTFSGNIMPTNPKDFILQSYCENDFKPATNIQPPPLMVEPNFSDSGKGGSVEDLNYRQFTGISTFTNSSFVNTSSANAKLFCPKPNTESSLSQCLFEKSSETMF